jgi:FMN phosphatase YigB (HAD superfamily)
LVPETKSIGERFPKAIFYDSKGALWAWPYKSWVDVSAQVLKKYKKTTVSPEEFADRWRLLVGGMRNANAFADDHFIDFNSLMKESIVAAGNTFGMRCKLEDAKGMDDFLLNELEPFPDTIAALTEQQKLGVQILTFTDAMQDHMRNMVARLKPFKPDFYGSTEQARLHKPNPLVYQWVLKKNNLTWSGLKTRRTDGRRGF